MGLNGLKQVLGLSAMQARALGRNASLALDFRWCTALERRCSG
jgi:hypothetical protein